MNTVRLHVYLKRVTKEERSPNQCSGAVEATYSQQVAMIRTQPFTSSPSQLVDTSQVAEHHDVLPVRTRAKYHLPNAASTQADLRATEQTSGALSLVFAYAFPALAIPGSTFGPHCFLVCRIAF